MTHTGIRRLVTTLIAANFLGLVARPAPAIPPFWEAFQAKYVAPDSNDPVVKKLAQQALAEATGKCLVCHVSGKPKSERNAYGAALAELLNKDDFRKTRRDAEPEKARAEIVQALDQIAAEKVDPQQPDGPTFGQLIEQGILPGTMVEEKRAAEAERAPVAAGDVPSPEPTPSQETPISPSGAGAARQLASELVGRIQSELNAQLRAELVPALRAELRAELRRQLKPELKAQLKESVKAAVLAELNSTGPVPSDEEEKAIEQIRQLGGSVMQLAQNDDSRVVSFHLSGTDLTDDQLVYLQSINKLAHLNLKGTKITDAGLVHLARIPSLTRLNLALTQVSDDGLRHLMGLDHLVYLNLYGSQVTDSGLPRLVGMTNLRKLFLWQSQVTEAGVKALREELPDCEISH
jgi:hypothetical protein